MFIVTLISTNGCIVSYQTVNLNEVDQKIPIYTDVPNDIPAYTEIVHMELTGSIFTTRKKLKERLVQRAVDEGCDAIIDARLKTTFIWPQAFGVGIKYKNGK